MIDVERKRMLNVTVPARRHTRAGRTCAVALAVVALTTATTACGALGLGGPRFAVGDCVRIEEQILDSDLNEASCGDAVGTFDASQRTYRVDTIIENTGGGCPQLAGFFPVEFVHEPDGVTYCLVQES